MRLIRIKITVDGEPKTLTMTKFTRAFTKFSKDVIKRARISLSKRKKNSTGNLHKSLISTLDIDKRTGEIKLDFNAPDAPYYQFVDQGVQGALTKKKAPKSPFKFGSGKGKKGGLRNGIRDWIGNKPIKQWKDKKTGRFLSYDQMTNLISRSIYQHGIEPTYFLSGSLERAFNKHKSRLEDAIVDDYAVFFGEQFKDKIEIEIEI